MSLPTYVLGVDPGPTTGGWGHHGSSAEHLRYARRLTSPGGRRKCHCGCGKRVTHTGCANGVALTSGCELTIRRWVRGAAS